MTDAQPAHTQGEDDTAVEVEQRGGGDVAHLGGCWVRLARVSLSPCLCSVWTGWVR